MKRLFAICAAAAILFFFSFSADACDYGYSFGYSSEEADYEPSCHEEYTEPEEEYTQVEECQEAYHVSYENQVDLEEDDD